MIVGYLYTILNYTLRYDNYLYMENLFFTSQ